MKMKKLTLWVMILFTVVLFLYGGEALHASQDPQDQKDFFTFGGRTRSYLFHVPSGYDPAKPIPLVLVLHGGGGNARGAVRMSRMDAKADKEYFIAAYPNGTGPAEERLLTWNAWNCC